ncbi:MAG: hypothetical protein HYS41_02070 [Candidatus Omnitrophica bacterium]|nr:hypothetical protein [Candidatus Omnitrophota bacterium]
MKNLFPGKTIYVLGAGASMHTGAPLLNDFLARSRSLVAGNSGLKWKPAFENVLSWVDSLRSPAYYLDLDLDNLEHIFSLIAMMQEVSEPHADEYYSDMSKLVFETLDKECQVQRAGGRYNPDRVYERFAKHVMDSNEERKLSMPQSQDVIVTLNYDVLLDYVFWFAYSGCDYCLTKSRGEGIRLLKLHGSMNWGRHRTCDAEEGKQIQVVRASPIADGHRWISHDEEKSQILPFQMFTHTLYYTKCRGCKKDGVLEPVFIPPTWFKSCREEQIDNVWKQAVEEFKTARQIVIVGYSLPPTDTFLPYLLMLGLANNAGLYRVVVVNPDNRNDLRSRYERMFSRNMSERGRLQFMPIAFEVFVERYLRAISEGAPIEA